MSRGPDAATLLLRAIRVDAAAAGLTFTVERARAERWASLTFTGARHDLTLRVQPAAGAERWIAALPEAELSCRRMLVADLHVTAVRRDGDAVVVELEVLTLEED